MGRWARWLLLVLVAQFVVLALIEAKGDGLSIDEAFDVTSGLTTVTARDTRFTNEHGLLPRVASAVPALLAHPDLPEGPGFESGDWFQMTADVLQANDDGAHGLDDVTFLARLVPIALAVAAGLGVHRLARMLHGEAAGLVAAAAWFTTPYLIGLGHLATTDVPFAAAVVWTSVALLAHLRAPSDRTAAIVGLALGAALLTRHLAVVVVATTVASMVISGWGDRRTAARHAVLALLVPFALVWIAYRAIDPGGGDDARLAGFVAAGHDDLLTRLVLLVPWPQEWAAGFSYLTLTSEPRPAYLFGQAWDGSRVWFFPGSALAKLPATLVVAIGAGLVAAVRRRAGGAEAVHVALVPAVALSLALLAQPLNLGLRYAVPVLALVLVLAAPVGAALAHRRGRVLLGGVLAVQVVACLVAVPHSLAWTPPPFTDGYRWVSDSNLDYGQDLVRLRDWEHIDGALVSVVAPRGLRPPPGSSPLLGVDPTTIEGWVAVGATSLTVVDRDELAWLRAYCPVGTIGGSILLYEFDEPPTAAPGPTLPVAPCDGSSSVRTG